MNLVAPIWEATSRWPDAPALVHSSRALNYREMCDAAELVATHLQRLGVRAQDCVAVAPDNPVMHLLCLLALARIGAVSAPAYRHLPADQWQALVARCRIKALIYSPAGAPWPATHLACLPATGRLADAELLAPKPPGTPPARQADLAPDAPWRIGLSSGTTGQPKAMARSHGDYAANLRDSQTLLQLGPSTRLMAHIDLAVFYALRLVLYQLTQGGAVVLAESASTQDCLACLQKYQVTHLHTTAWLASELAHALPDHPPGPLLAKPLQSLMMGGAAPDPAVCIKLLRHIAERLINNYGASETGPIAVAEITGNADKLDQSPLRLVPWAEAEAVDAQGQPLPAGQAGALRFRVRHACTSYLADPEPGASRFADGWFYSGDWGSADADGRLTLGARQDDIINLGGVKMDPQQVEAVIAAQPGVQACVVVGLQHPQLMLVAAVVPAAGANAQTLQTLPEALRQACAAQLPPDRIPAAWVLMPALPRNAQGKLLRQGLMEMLERDLARRE